MLSALPNHGRSRTLLPRRRRVFSVLTALHVLLHALLVLGHHVSNFCFLGGIEELIDLRMHLRLSVTRHF